MDNSHPTDSTDSDNEANPQVNLHFRYQVRLRSREAQVLKYLSTRLILPEQSLLDAAIPYYLPLALLHSKCQNTIENLEPKDAAAMKRIGWEMVGQLEARAIFIRRLLNLDPGYEQNGLAPPLQPSKPDQPFQSTSAVIIPSSIQAFEAVGASAPLQPDICTVDERRTEALMMMLEVVVDSLQTLNLEMGTLNERLKQENQQYSQITDWTAFKPSNP